MEASGGYGGSGTSGMLNHLSKKHVVEHAAIMKANALASKKANPNGERLSHAEGLLSAGVNELDYPITCKITQPLRRIPGWVFSKPRRVRHPTRMPALWKDLEMHHSVVALLRLTAPIIIEKIS